MPKHGRHRRGGRATPKGTQPARAASFGGFAPAPEEPDLLRDVRRALRSGEPLDVLAQVSSLLTVVDPRQRRSFGPRADEEPSVTRDELVGSFLDVPCVETSALLAVIAELAGDEVLRARIRRELDQRRDRLPEWLDRLGEMEIDRAAEMVHVLGDGDNIDLAIRLPGGHDLTFVVYIDHNLGTLVKDAFVVPESFDALIALTREKVDDPDTEFRPLGLADARVRIADAIELHAMTVPPFESDTWPACRPLLEWVLDRLPQGGAGYQRPEWSEQDLDALTERFFASSFGAPLDDADYRGMLDSVLWFGTGYGPGDPLRWSPVAIEIILDDWIPRKIVADAKYLSKAPALLRAFVRYCHAERGIRAELTSETLAAIDYWEPEYQDKIRSPRPQGPEALLVAMGVLDPDGPWDALLEFDDESYLRGLLLRAAGDEEALATLDDRPLPDEPFDWAGIPEDIHDKVAEVVAQCDSCCDEMLDVEYRTACRRLLARAASGDPNVFRRRGRAETAAAAICWAVGRDNDLFTPAGGGLLVRDLLAHFGLQQGSVSQRAATLTKAAGFERSWPAWDVRLGAPELLVSRRRRMILVLRDSLES